MIDREVAQLLLEQVHRQPWWLLFDRTFPGWQLEFERMKGDEAFVWSRKSIKVALWLPDPLLRAAHALTHAARHGCARGRTFTDAEEEEAEMHAMFWRSMAPIEAEYTGDGAEVL